MTSQRGIARAPAPPGRRSAIKKWLLIGLKFAVSAILIGYLATKVDLRLVEERIAAIAPGMVALAAATLLVQAVICTLRWQAVLNAIGAPLPFTRAFALFYIGAFFSQTLPSSVGGDAVRMYKAYRAGLSLSAAINGVMLERIATVIGLVLLVIGTQPVFLARVEPAVAVGVLAALAVLGAATVAGLGMLIVLDRLPSGWRRWRVVEGIARLGADARRLFLAPGHAARALFWSVVGHANVALAVYFLARGLAIDVGWIDCMALVPPVLLVTTLPISIAGWGVREAAMIAAFGLIGVPESSALALSVLLGLVVIATSLPGGVFWLASGDRRMAAPRAGGEGEATLAG